MHDHFAERLSECRAEREKALQQLKLIGDGHRIFTAAGTSPMVEVTDQFAERERATIARLDRQIADYEARNAQGS